MPRPPARPPSSINRPLAAGCLDMGRGVNVHAGGRGRQASPPRLVRPLKRLGSGRPAPWHRDGNERPASRRTHHTPLRRQFRAATLSARSQGVGGQDGCHVATVDHAAGGCGGQAGSADRHHQQPRTGRVTTPYSILIRRVTSARSARVPVAGPTTKRLPRSAILSSARLSSGSASSHRRSQCSRLALGGRWGGGPPPSAACSALSLAMRSSSGRTAMS